jgi:hypothetical protein
MTSPNALPDGAPPPDYELALARIDEKIEHLTYDLHQLGAKITRMHDLAEQAAPLMARASKVRSVFTSGKKGDSHG